MTDKPLKTKERLRRLNQDSIKQAKKKANNQIKKTQGYEKDKQEEKRLSLEGS